MDISSFYPLHHRALCLISTECHENDINLFDIVNSARSGSIHPLYYPTKVWPRGAKDHVTCTYGEFLDVASNRHPDLPIQIVLTELRRLYWSVQLLNFFFQNVVLTHTALGSHFWRKPSRYSRRHTWKTIFRSCLFPYYHYGYILIANAKSGLFFSL